MFKLDLPHISTVQSHRGYFFENYILSRTDGDNQRINRATQNAYDTLLQWWFREEHSSLLGKSSRFINLLNIYRHLLL